MSRFAVVFALGLCAALAPAAPVPRPVAEKERVEREWGRFAGAGERELRGRELTIRSAAYEPDQHTREFTTVPHTVRKVCGDFVATVRVTESSAQPVHDKESWHLGTLAGLFVAGGGSGFAHCRSALSVDGGKAEYHVVTVEWYPEWGRAKAESIPNDGPSIYLRLVRHGNELAVSHSANGTKWSKPRELADAFCLPFEVTVGVFVGTYRPRIASATFADLKIEPLKPEPKK
jgi:regulation of enolase protein 1 (concanavalin A-like superfamily)